MTSYWESGLPRFPGRQVRQILAGGLPVLGRKAGRLLALALAVPMVILARALRPVLLIRFGALRSHRIGHLAVNTEIYMCERELGMHGRRTLDFFHLARPIANEQLVRMWRRVLRVSPFVLFLNRVNRRIPGCGPHAITLPSDMDNSGLLARTRPHLAFTPAEDRLGRQGLREMGLTEGAPFVCFQSRDPAYLEAMSGDHSYRYHDNRDSSIHACEAAAEALVSRGYYAIRLGYLVKERLDTENPMIVDYASSYRTDFLDIYLGAKCDFYFGSGPGNVAVPAIFRRPLARVNSIPHGGLVSWHPSDLVIQKKLWLRGKARFMTFREIFDSEVKSFRRSEQYEQLGIDIVDNTPEEIRALALEMDDRLNGAWKPAEEDEELQSRYWSLFKSDEITRVETRIGAEFLRQNRVLLE